MRVALDTNVIISALVTRGLCRDLFRELVRHHTLIVPTPVLDESLRILLEKLGGTQLQAKRLAKILRETGHVEPAPKISGTWAAVVPDLDDRPILAAAMTADAQLFVTGDKALLELKSIAGMAIVSPRQAWERLRAGGK